MKVAHFAQFSPNHSGMYETVRDLIYAERAAGIDAEFIDWKADTQQGQDCSRVGLHDGSLITGSPAWAFTADVLVRHSLCPEPIQRVGIPVVMCLHGRPEYSYLLEHTKQSPVLSIMTGSEANPQYKAFVSFWPEHKQIWDLIVPGKDTHYVPAIVDLDKYSPEGKTFNFGGLAGEPNILVADIWREDITPFNTIFAAAEFQRRYCPGAKVHVFGTPPPGAPFISEMMLRLRNAGVVGIADCLVPFMPDVYRAADILVTPHNIATRVIRESLACGLPIVAGTGCRFTKYTADARDAAGFAEAIDRCWTAVQEDRAAARKEARATAEDHFDPERVGRAMLDIFTGILDAAKGQDPYAAPIEWTGWTLDPTDWIMLRDVIKERGIKKVLEIGAGTSTQLFEREGLEVVSYETMPTDIARVQRKTQYADIRSWNGRYLRIGAEGFEMALIDGPFGGENREPSYRAIAESDVPLVACHDCKRDADMGWVNKYFAGWETLAKNDQSVQGLLILKRSNRDKF